MIWIPTAIMFFAYTLIWFKLRKASKAFPYLSNQSRIARSRQKVIHMLFMLIIIELICWGPWQFWILCEYIIHKYYSSNVPGVRFNLFNVLNSNILSSMQLFSSGGKQMQQHTRFYWMSSITLYLSIVL